MFSCVNIKYMNFNTISLRRTTVFICAIVISLFWALSVHGQIQDGTSGLRIQPSTIEERIDPGETYNGVLRATNLAPELKQFYIIRRDIEGINQEGTPIFSDPNQEKSGFELTSWITVPDGPIGIAGNETREIPFSITVPKDASPGSHFGGIFLSLEPVKPETIGTGVGFQVGTVVVLRISGDIVEDARIREFVTDKDIYSSPKVKFSTRVENPGNVLVRPRGPIDITDFFGRKVTTLKPLIMNDPDAAVFPKSERTFEVQWEGDKLSFGRYEAVMSLVYGDEARRSVSSATSFWILPLNIILPVFAVLLALVLGIMVFVKLQVRRRLAQMGVQQSAGSPEPHIFPKSSPFSKLVFITIAMLLCTLIFLVLMFIFFA